MPPLQQRSSIMGQDPVVTSIPADFVALASICLFLTLLAASLRIFTKGVDLRRMQIEDYTIIFSTIGFTVFIGVMFAAARAGLPLSADALSFQQYKQAVSFSSALDIIYAPTMLAAKLAILIQLDRYIQTWKHVVWWSVRFLIVLNALCYTGIFIVQIINANFNSKMIERVAPGFPATQSFTAFTSGTANIISDVVVLVVAVFGVAALQLSMRRKVLLTLMLAVGSFACVASIVKLVYETRVDVNANFTATIWPVYMWSVGELTSIIYCACSPTFPRLLQYIQGRSLTGIGWANIDDSRPESRLSDWEIDIIKKSNKPNLGKRYYYNPSASHITLSSNSSKSIRSNLSRSGSQRSVSRNIYYDAAVRNASRTSLRGISPAPIQPKKSLRRVPIHRVDASQRLSAASPLHYAGPPIPHFPPSTPVYTIPEDEVPATPITPGSPTQSHFPLSPTLTHSTSWPSPTQTEFSVAEVENATHIRMQPVYFATIRKTVDVRVSSHTAPGSPLTWRKGSLGW
ncbi:hypothetical protein DM02DRAFT_627831 [Periconia macrospinosa]|uniref:Rhodopsin domain-containing protein n=1 Tax=Periconia macrospinosa TaxID=97972 RepID=A0A2V1DWH2_9PLEO|nr:hypothetical protein DM02DRAFT_627831 [Periconia macrospinosa]